jgi:hypothetical protein
MIVLLRAGNLQHYNIMPTNEHHSSSPAEKCLI